MRKPVQTEPTPAPDNHARGEKQANSENTEVLSRRCHAKGEAGVVSNRKSFGRARSRFGEHRP